MSEVIDQFLRKNLSNGFNAGWMENVKADVRTLQAENDALHAEIKKLTNELKAEMGESVSSPRKGKKS